MGRPADAYNAFRRRILPGIHSVLDVLIGGYALSDTPPEEYVGTLECEESAVEELLSAWGFSRNVVASLKVRIDGNVSDGSWVYRPSLFAAHQLHVILHESETGVEMYAHWEYSSIRHPYRHYLARDYSAEVGVSLVRTILKNEMDDSGISWRIEPRHRRHNWYVSILAGISTDLTRELVDIRERFEGGVTPETQGIVQRTASIFTK